MNDLKTVSGLVKHLLVEDEKTRNSDNYLYLKVLEHHACEMGVDLHQMTVPAFLMRLGSSGFPGFETVRRSRQKVQEIYPELAPTEAVGRFRSRNEQVYRGFASSNV